MQNQVEFHEIEQEDEYGDFEETGQGSQPQNQPEEDHDLNLLGSGLKLANPERNWDPKSDDKDDLFDEFQEPQILKEDENLIDKEGKKYDVFETITESYRTGDVEPEGINLDFGTMQISANQEGPLEMIAALGDSGMIPNNFDT